ncbi:MAG: hypothetical protein JOZ25_09970 [Actinobacteria bacterium]|nr:hypothetical protein [Actinomycetota bacterium]
MDDPQASATFRRRRALLGLVVLLAVIGVLGWLLVGQGGGGGPQNVAGTASQVVTATNSLQHALAGRDYQTICDSLFTIGAREAAGGDNCPSVLAQNGARIASPAVSIRSVAVAGDRATVNVLASAAGQPTASDQIHFVREGGRFRIASAGIVRGR